MFDQFGEFESYREINMLAENLFNEGDLDSLKSMAAENGIPKELTEMYLQGETEELCDPVIAAIGKIDVESEELDPKEIMEDWVEYIKNQCMASELMAHQVRKKGKTLKGCIAELLKWSFRHQIPVDRDIITAAGVKTGKVTLGIPGMGTAKRIIRNYYMGD